MTAKEIIINILSTGTLIIQIFILIYIITLVTKNKISDKINKFLYERNIEIIIAISLIAVLASLFISEIAGIDPCKLCWYQRAFTYPILIIALVSLITKERVYAKCILSLAAISLLIGTYHYSLQIKNVLFTVQNAVCSATGPSCSQTSFMQYGYITIPLMNITAMLLIIILCIIKLKTYFLNNKTKIIALKKETTAPK